MSAVNSQVSVSAPNSRASGPPGQADTLSDHVKMVIAADKQQATAVGIVLALFAGALVSLAQLVEGVDTDTSSASWQALRVFLYGAIMFNLSGAFLSLVAIKMCSDLPLANYQKQYQVTRPNHTAPPTTEKSALPIGVESWSRLGILLHAGMSPRYSFVDEASKWVLLTAMVCTFASLAFWVFLNTQNGTTSGITMVFYVPAAAIAASAFVIAGRAEGWS